MRRKKVGEGKKEGEVRKEGGGKEEGRNEDTEERERKGRRGQMITFFVAVDRLTLTL